MKKTIRFGCFIPIFWKHPYRCVYLDISCCRHQMIMQKWNSILTSGGLFVVCMYLSYACTRPQKALFVGIHQVSMLQQVYSSHLELGKFFAGRRWDVWWTPRIHRCRFFLFLFCVGPQKRWYWILLMVFNPKIRQIDKKQFSGGTLVVEKSHYFTKVFSAPSQGRWLAKRDFWFPTLNQLLKQVTGQAQAASKEDGFPTWMPKKREGQDGWNRFLLTTWMFLKIVGFPPNHPWINRVFHYKPFILGYRYFWKYPHAIKSLKDLEVMNTSYAKMAWFKSWSLIAKVSLPFWELGRKGGIQFTSAEHLARSQEMRRFASAKNTQAPVCVATFWLQLLLVFSTKD